MKQLKLKFALMALLLYFAMSTCFAYDFEVDRIEYSILSITQKTVSVAGGTNGYIPSTVSYDGKVYTVTEIGKFAFQGSSISSFILPNSLKAIRNCAFRYARGAKEIDIPDNVEELGEQVFSTSSFQTIIVGSGGGKKNRNRCFLSVSRLETFSFQVCKSYRL